MPETGYYEKIPRPDSRRKLVSYLNSRALVLSVEEVSEQLIKVHREGKPVISAFLTNVYIVGLADVHDILADQPNIDAIVTMSAWNGYTEEAKAYCKERNLGLFKFSEFLGAVYYSGSKFLDYVPPEK